MRQHNYEVGDGSDIDAMPGQKTYTVLCRSWNDSDPDADSWSRVVNWYTDRATAQRDADQFNADWEQLQQTRAAMESVAIARQLATAQVNP